MFSFLPSLNFDDNVYMTYQSKNKFYRWQIPTAIKTSKMAADREELPFF